MTPLVSVIVPIYKVEPYLAQCVDSIINQTYKNLEIILVDDGSPDKCPQMCDEYAKKDCRIIVIHKENGGLSDARNAGLDICKGEYISFVDSDDWIAENFVESLLKITLKENAQIAIGNNTLVHSLHEKKKMAMYPQSVDWWKKNSLTNNYETLTNVEAEKKLWSKDGIAFGTAWGKLFKNELFENVRFPKGRIHEDEYTTYKILYQANKIVFLDTPLYFYLQRPNSITHSVAPSSITALKAWENRYYFFKENNQPELQQLCLNTLCWDLLFAYAQYEKQKDILERDYPSKGNLRRTFQSLMKDYNLLMRHRMVHIFFLNFFYFFPFAYLFYQKISFFRIRSK